MKNIWKLKELYINLQNLFSNYLSYDLSVFENAWVGYAINWTSIV